MSEHPEPTSVEDVLQSSELAARLLRRLIASPGVIDTRRLFRTYARLTEVITHAHPLLHDLLARHSIDDDSTLQNLPLVMDQPWMLNLNTYLTNNNSYSSSATTNNSFFATSNQFIAPTTNQSFLGANNQFMSPPESASSTTHSELHSATSQSTPPETFRVSRRPVDRRQSASVEIRETLVRAPLAPPMVQRELPETVMKTSRLLPNDTALPQKPGSVLGQGQYRNAVASGESPNTNNSSIIDPQRRADAAALPYRHLPTVIRDTEPKDTLRIKNDRHSVTERSIEVRQGTNTTRTLSEKTDTAAPAAAPPALPVVQEHPPSPQFQSRPQQLVWRQNAESLTLSDLVSDLSSNSPLAAVRQALDSMPATQLPPSSQQIIKPESSSRAEDETPIAEEITTDGMLRRISRMLLIERERRGY